MINNYKDLIEFMRVEYCAVYFSDVDEINKFIDYINENGFNNNNKLSNISSGKRYFTMYLDDGSISGNNVFVLSYVEKAIKRYNFEEVYQTSPYELEMI